MSGHSKWSTIKHKKAAVDAKRGKVFSKLARLITIESKITNGDVNAPSLKVIVQKAKEANMPKDNIERAIAKGVSGGGGESCVLYELYGPGGVALLINALTDNSNRTVAELKHILSKLGYQLAEPGSAQWAFTKEGDSWKPVTTIPVEVGDIERLDALVETLLEHDDVESVYTNHCSV